MMRDLDGFWIDGMIVDPSKYRFPKLYLYPISSNLPDTSYKVIELLVRLIGFIGGDVGLCAKGCSNRLLPLSWSPMIS